MLKMNLLTYYNFIFILFLAALAKKNISKTFGIVIPLLLKANFIDYHTGKYEWYFYYRYWLETVSRKLLRPLCHIYASPCPLPEIMPSSYLNWNWKLDISTLQILYFDDKTKLNSFWSLVHHQTVHYYQRYKKKHISFWLKHELFDMSVICLWMITH